MGVLAVAFRLAAAAIAPVAMSGSVYAAVVAPAGSIAGAWKGPFLGTNFTFEFRQTGSGWTGRYESEKFGKWVDLQNVSFTDGILRFTIQSQPPSMFNLKVDNAGKSLNGSATFGPHPALPLTLNRAS